MFDARFRSAQSLVELLVGIAIGAIFIIGAATIIAPSLEIGKQTALVQTKTELANEMLDNVKAWAAGNWDNVLALATGTTNTFYLNTATSSFTVGGFEEPVAIGSTTFNRYFYLSDVYRDANGNVTTTATGTNYDPSTKLVTVVVNASGTNLGSTSTLSFYLTRNGSNNFNQTSWSGGSGQSNSITVVGTNYASSSNITINASGSIQLSSGGNSCVL